MAVNLQGIRRNIKNVAHNYTDAQVKVREATSNDPWGPSSTMMSEIADLTYNVSAFSEIMHMVWKRLNDHGKNWRHVYKALVLLEYLIKTGSEKVAQQCKENIFAIQTLKDFQYLDDNKDQGINVREKAKALVALLKDDDRLKNERVRALKAKERFAQSAAAIGSDTVYNRMVKEHYEEQQRQDPMDGSIGTSPTNFEVPAGSDLEAARPHTAGEEGLQLQLALAMSREGHGQEETKTKSDDVRLQLALQKSKETAVGNDVEKSAATSKPSNDLLDLVDLNFISSQQQQQPPPPKRTSASALDPWGMPAPPSKSSNKDPWGGGEKTEAQSDPWGPASPSSIPPGGGFGLSGGMGDGKAVADDDPWKSEPATADPWMSSNQAEKNNNIDPFSHVAQKELVEFDLLRDQMEQQQHQPSNPTAAAASPNPFDLGELGSRLSRAGESGSSVAPTGAKPKKGGGVQSILGEHSNLVNLDHLVSSSGSSQVRNPFEQQPPNPFQAAKAPKPAMNELLQQKNSSGWHHQQHHGSSTSQPQNQPDINPFF